MLIPVAGIITRYICMEVEMISSSFMKWNILIQVCVSIHSYSFCIYNIIMIYLQGLKYCFLKYVHLVYVTSSCNIVRPIIVLYVHSVVTCEWSVIKAISEEGSLPRGRYAHACSLNGPIMYIQVSLTYYLTSLYCPSIYHFCI